MGTREIGEGHRPQALEKELERLDVFLGGVFFLPKSIGKKELMGFSCFIFPVVPAMFESG